MIFIHVLICLIAIALIVYIAIDSHKVLNDSPLDDSQWAFDEEAIEARLKSFIGNRKEKIIGVLGKRYVAELLNKEVPSNGFCFLTDKAYYFIGDVYQKKYVINWKSNIQHRINISEMKGVKVGALYYGKLIIFTAGMVGALYYFARTIWKFTQIAYEYDRGIYNMLERSKNPEVLLAFFMVSSVIGIIIVFIAIVYGVVNLLLTRRTRLCLEFDSQTFSFPINVMGEREIKKFYSDISKVQSTIEREIFPQTAEERQMNERKPVSNKSKVEALTELSALYENKLIDAEEYNKLKKEIIEEKND